MRWNITLAMSYSDNREIPLDVDELLKHLPPSKPETDWQALMEAPPGFEPMESKQVEDEISDIVRDCVELLLDQDKYIVHGIAYERISYEELGYRLGCSAPHAWRLKQIAYANLKEILLLDDRFKSFLENNGYG